MPEPAFKKCIQGKKLQSGKVRHSLEWPLTWGIWVGKVASCCVPRNSIGSGGKGVGERAVCQEMMIDIREFTCL